ncbi:sphingosine-1-phosphate phosphohydrolase-like protein [Westerdykella ornata]|uniref:Sphingosine-1-phosphate phosphohydrolase-like protein n=1 Tax=Westerdykella ornata TaxID=318751 RepID=A0A6A6JBP4_WESOR|nr:sphingosine-1-phosphate phosphohydrolase-like protein [Westerdykella ornata]KAF2273056.1 sphingosine-1-phosphate phosphohydrolase-like protein [Westerdykella ornata]
MHAEQHVEEAADAVQSSRLPTPEPRLDAGNKDHDHYARRLPAWRNSLRKTLIPVVRWETPYLALLQEKVRTPALDSYFAYTANLGTHTFYMVFLPILFWCGHTHLGRAMVHMLAAGIYFSGVLKDMLCLPRPLSPPLYRITMSGSAALEYGFPSSHSTNAVSVAMYCIHLLRSTAEQHHPNVYLGLQLLAYFFAATIVFGRLYCGMHGFLDVIVGSLLGAVLGQIQIVYGHTFDLWIAQGNVTPTLIALLVILVLIRTHPEPADDCPCYDDTIAFAGVVMGVQLGAWHFSQSRYSIDTPIPSTVHFDFHHLGLLKTTLRIALGVLIVFVWRAIMKPALLKILPPIYRVLERVRMLIPRAFFLNASNYTSVPHLHGDDNLIPPASEIPHMLNNLVHPRKRAVSVGPQSAADAYETLAYRNRRRRESLKSAEGTPIPKRSSPSPTGRQAHKGAVFGADLLPTPAASRVQSLEQMMGTGKVSLGLLTPPKDSDYVERGARMPNTDLEDEKRELFDQLTKPRVRYDVEVVTKLIVYGGIAWLAVEGNPILFECIGLGMR